MRHSFDTASGKEALHFLNAWPSNLQVCLGQGVIDIVSNEITGVQKLLEFQELTNAVFRLDGRHCQNETAEAIRDKAVGSVLTVTAVIRRAKTSPPSAPKTGRRVGY